MIGYLYGGMLLLSMVLIFSAVKQYSNTKALLSTGTPTVATVIDMIEVRSSDGYTYKPVYEYVDGVGAKVVFESSISAKPAPHDIGDQVDIICSQNGDDRKIVSFWGLYRWPVILLSLASPLLIIGGGYLLYIRG